MEVDELSRIIRDEIHRDGIITVARFMELALYTAGWGFYRRSRTRFGRDGDFYTAEQLQPLFGDVIARVATELAESAARSGESFSVLEVGAGSGEMRSALARWNYRGFDWTGDALPDELHGLILSNEFFDALPVHLLIRTAREWQELGVKLAGERLTLERMRPTASGLVEYARQYAPSASEGTRLEVCVDAALWFERLSRLHKSGVLLIIDYGYAAGESPRFPEGTLMGYRKHAASADFLNDPGEQDITAHVNFSYLADLAVRFGYETRSNLPLRSWLLQVWDRTEFEALWREKDSRWRLQWKQLLAGMGDTFRVLELSRRVRPS
jgi:SAM-dependent MidA family methyltransferase